MGSPFDKLRVLADYIDMAWYTYILLCDGTSYYVGLSGNLGQRLASHKAGHNIGTKEFADVELVYHETYKTRHEAELRETQLKKWSRAKKKALIEGNLALLRKLSHNPKLVEDTLGQ